MRTVLSACILFSLIACQEKKSEPAAAYSQDGFAAFNADSLGKNISILASDAFQGRKPFTEGETKTVDFLQKAFGSVGLEPGNGKSYLRMCPW
jgi:hypothetical protein